MKKSLYLVVFCTALILFGAIDYKDNKTEERPLPSFARYYDIKLRKRQFFDFMRPIIEAENNRVLSRRKKFLALYRKKNRGDFLSVWDRKKLRRYARMYRLDPDACEEKELWETLKRRIDIVPTELALAQSAHESAWGMSRFAVEGNAMFGQWTYSRKSEGMIPRKRKRSARHKVAKFPSVRAAVQSYIRNLNTHSAYLYFRKLRSKARENGLKPDGHNIAHGLINYSEKRQRYVREIQTMIKSNKPLMGL